MSNLAQYLAANDAEIWNGDDPPDTEDVLSSALRSLDAIADEFRGLGDKLDAQSANGEGLAQQVAQLNKTMALMVQTQIAMKGALIELTRTMMAPRRIIKGPDGKPIGVEVMKG